MFKLRLIAVALLCTVLLSACSSDGESRTSEEPVVLVHGFLGKPRDLQPMKDFLDANGFHAFIAILPGENNVENAEYIASYVEEIQELTGRDKVDIVGFSMGGVSARQYIRFNGGEETVSHYVALDSPQYGDRIGCIALEGFGGQMCPASRFLSDLNNGDDTPGDVNYTSIINTRSDNDWRLKGGATEYTVTGEHNDLPRSEEVFAIILKALRS